MKVISFPHDSQDTPDILCRHARRRIRSVARRLIGKARFTPADREDIEQELTVRLWRGLRRFNPAIGDANAFVATILNRAANSILRSRSSDKRGCFRTHQSLPVSFRAGDGDACDDDSPVEAASSIGSHEQDIDLIHDVEVVLHALPRDLRQLAEELKTCRVSEIAQRHDVARSTVYAQVAKLRMVFVAADLKNHPARSDTSRAFREVNR